MEDQRQEKFQGPGDKSQEAGGSGSGPSPLQTEAYSDRDGVVAENLEGTSLIQHLPVMDLPHPLASLPQPDLVQMVERFQQAGYIKTPAQDSETLTNKDPNQLAE